MLTAAPAASSQQAALGSPLAAPLGAPNSGNVFGTNPSVQGIIIAVGVHLAHPAPEQPIESCMSAFEKGLFF
jgi:hypothetical protein